MTNAGSLRASIKAGQISYADLVAAVPFENILGFFELQGKYIREALEKGPIRPNLLQISGLKVTYNQSRSDYEKIVELKVLCRSCEGIEYEDVEDEEWYGIAMVTYLTGTRKMFPMIHDNMRNHRYLKCFTVHLFEYHYPLLPIKYLLVSESSA
jgi:5'-nucleotidase